MDLCLTFHTCQRYWRRSSTDDWNNTWAKMHYIKPLQSAYRKFHSTETALLKVQNDILLSLDQGCATVLVMLDLSAAFDTIDHGTLLRRLENRFGVSDKCLSWINSYLSKRFQTVCVDGELSEPVLMKYSVPQGSVLGPKYFIMYTKPVGDICRAHGLIHHFYADDSQIYIAFKPMDSVSQNKAIKRVEHCLSDIVSWMNLNMLKLNTDKTEVMLFASQTHAKQLEPVSLCIGDSVIQSTSKVKNLGATFTTSMDMEQHVNMVCRSAYFQLRNIGRIRPYLTVQATKSIINCLVTSRLDYCNSLQYMVPHSVLNKLQRVQNSAARIICRTSRFDHITPVLKELHWLPINCRIEHKILTLTYKALHDLSPIYMADMIQIYTPPRTLRSTNELSLVIPRIKPVWWSIIHARCPCVVELTPFKHPRSTHTVLL